MEALDDVSRDRQRAAGQHVPKDRKWQSSRNVPLAQCTSLEKLFGHITLHKESMKNRMKQMGSDVGYLFRMANWPEDGIELWKHVNLFSRIARDSGRLYLELLIHLVSMAQEFSWESATTDLEYYGSKLKAIRSNAPGRLTALVSIYVFLRDSSNDDWNSRKLAHKREVAMRQEICDLQTANRDAGGGGKPHKMAYPGCSHCKTATHYGGKTQCPWKEEPADVAMESGRASLRALGEKKS